MSISKVAFHEVCMSVLKTRIEAAQKAIADTQEGANNDTKSSAGDKHETGRAMAQREVETRQKALAQLVQLQKMVVQIDPSKPCSQIAPGALLTTNNGTFYIASALGKIPFENEEILVVSFGAPLIQAMKSCKTGDSCIFNGKTWTVSAIW